METKKEYKTPEIIFETDLETKAGSPLGLPGVGIDLLSGEK